MTVTVPANQAWTPTGLTVRSGESVSFNANGQIKWAQGASNVAGPDGARAAADSMQHYPVRGRNVGLLIGRVGPNGQPFAVGANNQVTMPASGELYLGVNDDYLVDNSGSFTVQITTGSGQ